MGLYDNVENKEAASAAMSKFYGEEKDKPLQQGGSPLMAVGKFVFTPLLGIKGKGGEVISPAIKTTTNGAKQMSLMLAVADGKYKGDTVWYNITLEPTEKTKAKIEGTISMLTMQSKVFTGTVPESLVVGDEFEKHLYNKNNIGRSIQALVQYDDAQQSNKFDIKRIFPFEDGMVSIPDEVATTEVVRAISGSVGSGGGAAAGGSGAASAEVVPADGKGDDGWDQA